MEGTNESLHSQRCPVSISSKCDEHTSYVPSSHTQSQIPSPTPRILHAQSLYSQPGPIQTHTASSHAPGFVPQHGTHLEEAKADDDPGLCGMQNTHRNNERHSMRMSYEQESMLESQRSRQARRNEDVLIDRIRTTKDSEAKEFNKLRYETTWDSCCLRLDKRATIFFSQLSISILVMMFSTVQLVRLDDCESQQAYIGLLTLCLGVWLPQPSMAKGS
jgi:hypothetical protein